MEAVFGVWGKMGVSLSLSLSHQTGEGMKRACELIIREVADFG